MDVFVLSIGFELSGSELWPVAHDDSGWVAIHFPLVFHPFRDVPTGDVTSHQDEGVTAGVACQHRDVESVEKRAREVESILLVRYCRSWDIPFVFSPWSGGLERMQTDRECGKGCRV